MAQDTDRKRTIEGRIERIRARLQKQADENIPAQRELIAVLRAMIDLLEDEL